MSRKTILFFFSLLSSLHFLSARSPFIQEGVWIKDPQLKYYSYLKNQTEFVIDHRKAKGFELYGTKELYKFLDENHIPYTKLDLAASQKSASKYPSFQKIEAKLKKLHHDYPQQTQLMSIGKSVLGRDLYFLKISKNPTTDAKLPEFKYISSMHGDEITGRELMISLAEDLLSGYGKDSKITELIDNTEIYIMPSMNPDGSELRQRYNANNADLNRDFPDFTSDPQNTAEGRQIETAAIMKFQSERNFSLSANFHGGSEVVNYPWDTTDMAHPFEALLKELSLGYAQLVPYIFQSREFPQGITNGFAWYEVNGGMQDWSEFYYHDLQFTVELSDAKWPDYNKIPKYYQDNKTALIEFIKKIHQGSGFYFKNKTEMTGSVTISKATKELGTYQFNHGEFYRVLEPGLYDFSVNSADGKSYTFTTTVREDEIKSSNHYTIL
jgi:hypothetical protein